MDTEAWAALLHPALTVVFVFPIIGIVTHFAWQVRQRRLQTRSGEKSKIPPVVGREHVQIGKWLSASVVGASLIGLAHPIIFKNILAKELWSSNPFQLLFLVVMFGATIAALVLLYRAREGHWRGIFATLTGAGIVILGSQDGVFRRTNEWYVSHYYFGVTVSLLMILSLAMVAEIYRGKAWRIAHALLNTVALLLFIGQGLTGARDLFEIALYTPPPGFVLPWF